MADGTSAVSSASSLTRPSVNAWNARQAARVADGSATARTRPAHPECVGELEHDPILQFEDAIERAVRLGLGLRLAGVRVDDSRRDPQPIAGTLKTPDHGSIQVELRAQGREVRPGATARFNDADAIDHAMR